MTAPAPANQQITRRKTPTVNVGGVLIGSDHPVVVQAMTNTHTADVEFTVNQVAQLAEAGSELVRITVNNDEAAQAVPKIKAGLEQRGINTPLVGDFHYNGHLLLTRYPECAATLAKYRINPGNVGGKYHNENFRAIIDQAIHYGKPVRIGVNWGSLDQNLVAQMMDDNAKQAEPLTAKEIMLEAIVQSAVQSARLAEEFGMAHNAIVLSAKVSDVPDLITVYRRLAALCDFPLHLGLTEAGMGMKGMVASTAALAVLLAEGVGDTIRVSLTPTPGGDRAEEVRVAQQILQSLELRNFMPQVTSCPGCGRTASTFFQQMAQEIQQHIQAQMPIWRRKYPGVEELRVAVMGCVVNGPGESRHADIGISLPGTFEEPAAPVFIDGKLVTTLRGDRLVSEFKQLIDEYVPKRWG